MLPFTEILGGSNQASTPSVRNYPAFCVSVFGQSQTLQILIKYIGKTINNYETK
jgi:hypothetical protein